MPDFNYWSKRAKKYEDPLFQWLLYDRVQNKLLTFIKTKQEPKKIIDIGCGTGRLLRKIEKIWPKAQLIGIDPSEGMIEKAKKLTPKAKFYIARAESIPLPDNSVDMILSTLSFHHWSDQPQGVSEIWRVLKPKGRLYIANKTLPISLKLYYILKGKPYYKAKNIFSKAGFKIEIKKINYIYILFRIEMIIGKK